MLARCQGLSKQNDRVAADWVRRIAAIETLVVARPRYMRVAPDQLDRQDRDPASGASPAIRWSSTSAIVRPISAIGWRTVVRPGSPSPHR